MIAFFSIGALLLLPADGERDSSVPEADKLERRALDYRRHVFRSGRVVYHYDPKGINDQGVLEASGEYEYHVIFDESRVRFGWRGRLLPDGRWGGIDWVILNNGKYISDPRRDFAVLVARQEEYQDVREHFQIFHPNAVGMSVNGLTRLARDGLGQLLNRTDRTAKMVTPDEIDGVRTWRIDYDLEHDGAAAVWIAEKQGYGVLRAEQKGTMPTGERVTTGVRSWLRQYEDGGVWYPEKTVTQMMVDDRIVQKETVQVTEAEFNTPINPEEFTLKGLDLAVGRSIVDRSEGPPRGLTWDGEKAIGISAEEVRRNQEAAKTLGTLEKRASPAEPTYRRWLLYANVVVLSVAAVALAWRGLRARRHVG